VLSNLIGIGCGETKRQGWNCPAPAFIIFKKEEAKSMISEIFMSFLGLLFSLVGVFFVALIGLGVLIFFIIEINKKGGVAPKILVYIIGYMLLVVLSYKILLFDLNTPSKVDISPVYNLTKITGARIISSLRTHYTKK
jgi:hypothetical protein